MKEIPEYIVEWVMDEFAIICCWLIDCNQAIRGSIYLMKDNGDDDDRHNQCLKLIQVLYSIEHTSRRHLVNGNKFEIISMLYRRIYFNDSIAVLNFIIPGYAITLNRYALSANPTEWPWSIIFQCKSRYRRNDRHEMMTNSTLFSMLCRYIIDSHDTSIALCGSCLVHQA